ncbi:MAG: hypothetical protein EKK55_07030 [Rhodocyclaceae bacterium]|nr:MAG: hypothetical protein EKK55_07030 [Rhodocyclaceae bacterium]
MALTTCKDCNNQISTDAKACPKCGKPQRRPISLARIVGLVLLILMVLGYLAARDYDRKARGALDLKPAQSA